MLVKGWFTLPTESEAESESEAQRALRFRAFRSSVNQKTESEAESEARRNRSQKDQKSFFYFRFRFRFRRFRSSENKVNGIRSESGIISQSKNYVEVCVSCIWDVEQVCKTLAITLKTKIQN